MHIKIEKITDANSNPVHVFLGDKVEMKWNRPGNCVLLMTSTDVDTSGASYYGKQSLHLLDVKGNSSMVQLGKFLVFVDG